MKCIWKLGFWSQEIARAVRQLNHYKIFFNKLCKKSLVFQLFVSESFQFDKLEIFLEICEKTLNKYIQRKKKCIRGIHSPFGNKELSKSIMKRTRLRNKFLRNRSTKNKEIFNKQRDCCVLLVRKSKKEYYGNLNQKNVADKKTFWKTMKLFLSSNTAK